VRGGVGKGAEAIVDLLDEGDHGDIVVSPAGRGHP
jgi:hypothetical protein